MESEVTVNGYFDANATTPLHPAARAAWLAAPWHNPSSLYREAAEAREQLEDCRLRLAGLLGCDPGDVVFLSGATEANNAVIDHFARRGDRIAVSSIEHPSVREPASGAVHFPATPGGIADLDALRETLGRERPALVSLMAANNETGVLQPWRETLALCREEGVAFHCDAAQWLGKLPCAGLGDCDFLTGSAHKFGGPKGTGFLKISPSHTVRWLRGGPQEERRRAGTENLPGVLAMLAALEAQESRLSNRVAWEKQRAAFETAVKAAIPDILIVGEFSPRLWNTVLLVLPEFANVKWLARLSRAGFQVSTGSACSSGGGASEVLAAMGLPADDLRRVLRISSTWDQTPEDWSALASAIASVYGSLRATVGSGSP
jgi:cysteine desulfurase